MRVLAGCFPAASHLYPMVPLLWALRNAGHEVRVVVPPAFVPAAVRTGLPAQAVGRDVDGTAAWVGFDPRAGDRTARTARMFGLVAEGMVDALTDEVRRGADAVLFDPRGYAAPVAAALAGVPSVRVLYGVDHTYDQRGEEWPLLAPLWRDRGLSGPVPAGDLTLDCCPAALQTTTPDHTRPLRYVPFNGSGRVPPPGPADRPRVCVTWGRSTGAATGRLDPVSTVLAGLAGLDVTPVVLVDEAQRALLGPVPDRVRVLESVPLHAVLSDCAAIVHQGGAGATLTAAACGVVQVVVPAKGDQLVHAARVAAAGSGLVLAADRLNPGEVGAAVRRVLDDTATRAAAARIAAENASRPSPAAVAAALPELLGRDG